MTEKYFASSSEPSIFDKIASKPFTSSSSEEDSTFLRMANKDPIAVADEVRDLWELTVQEPGIPPRLTMPGVVSVEDLSDPVKETITVALGPEEAKKIVPLTCNDVTQDERGLRRLIDEGCFRAAVNLTSRLLTMYGQGYGRLGQPAKHTPHSLQLWFTRFTLLVKLGLFEQCQMESDAFGELDRPDIFYEFYPEMYSNRRGSMASFSFRILLAEFPMYLGAPNIALNRLTVILNICKKIEKLMDTTGAGIQTVKFWRRRRVRAQHSIINCALVLKNYNLAKHFIESIIEEKCWSNEELGSLNSVAGRIYLQCGDILAAEKKLASMKQLGLTSKLFQVQECIDKGLIYVAQNNFEEAVKFFQKAATLEPGNTMIANNIAVCFLYLGRMKDAIATYENTMPADLKQSINEHFFINLCTLYELESNFSRPKKLIQLQKLAKEKRDICMSIEVEQHDNTIPLSPGKIMLKSWLNRNFRIVMTDGRILVGVFLCTDGDANVILGMCSEYTEEGGEERILGLVMIPGRHIVSMEVDMSGQQYES